MTVTDVKFKDDQWRGRAAWHMQLVDILIGHEILGFDYVMSGDSRPSKAVTS